MLATVTDATGSTPAERTILVADDDRQCRRAVQEALERIGLRTLAAETGLEALEVVRRELAAIHACVFDIHMPEMSGIDALRTLRNERILVPVIVMTSDRSEEVHERALTEGAASLVEKPIDLAIIRRTVMDVLLRGV